MIKLAVQCKTQVNKVYKLPLNVLIKFVKN